jgi:lipoprotein signal peptidase
MDSFLDVFAEILWYSIPITPIITIPIVWRFAKNEKKITRVLYGLLFAGAISICFFAVSMGLCFRNGLGP